LQTEILDEDEDEDKNIPENLRYLSETILKIVLDEKIKYEPFVQRAGIMSCSINRYKNCGTSSTPRRPETESAKAMDARLADMLAVRTAQDRGDFRARTVQVGETTTATATAIGNATATNSGATSTQERQFRFP
jgi:hypothetical protein